CRYGYVPVSGSGDRRSAGASSARAATGADDRRDPGDRNRHRFRGAGGGSSTGRDLAGRGRREAVLRTAHFERRVHSISASRLPPTASRENVPIPYSKLTLRIDTQLADRLRSRNA